MKILEILTRQRLTGNFGENAAKKHLKRSGYKVIETNYVALNNEIDIIAENKTTIAFVEVKTRSVDSKNKSEYRPAAAVTPEKQRKIIKAAKYYLASSPTINKKARLDVIEVYVSDLQGRKKVEKIFHIENAFNQNTASSRK